jgi:hypothetical protein
MAEPRLITYKECEYKDIKMFFEGKELVKARGIKYKSKKDKQLLHAAGDKAVSVQSGNRDNEGTLTMLRGALVDLNRAAVAAGYDDILDVQVDLVIVYKQKGIRGMQTDTLVGVEFTEYEDGMMQGDKFKDVDLPFVFLQKVTV